MTESAARSNSALFSELPERGWFSNALGSAANLAITGSFIWLVAQGAFQFRLTPRAVLIEAAGCAFLALVSSLGAGAALRAMAPFRDREFFAAESRRTAAVAIWFAPAAILLAHASPAALLAAPILAIRTVRLLYEQKAEESEKQEVQPASAPGDALFAQFSYEKRPFLGGLAFSVPAPAAVQAGLGAIALHRALFGAILAAIGAAMLTLIALSRGEGTPARLRRTWHPGLQLALNISLATLLTIAGLAVQVEYRDANSQGLTAGGKSGGFAGALEGILGTQSARAGGGTAGSPQNPPALGLGGDYPGVVLWPEVKSYALLIAPTPQGAGWGVPRNPYRIPFGGEYWMYRAPWRRPPIGSYFRRATPVFGVFKTSDGVPLRMEATHKLDQYIEAQCCSEIQLDIMNAEPDSNGVALELILADRERRLYQNLGMRGVLSKPKSTQSPTGESLDFRIAPDPLLRQFNEFRVVFHRGPKMSDKSVRIAIERFVLIPR